MGLRDLYTRQDEFNNPRSDFVYGDLEKFYSSLIQASTTVDKKKLEEQIMQAKIMATVLGNSVIMIKDPAYVTPPFRASNVDLYNNTPIAFIAGQAVTNLVSITLTETQILCVRRVGVECENLGAHQDIGVSLYANNADIKIQTLWQDGLVQAYTYQQFHPRLGTIEDPWWLPKPIIVTGPATFAVVAQNDSAVNAHRVTARLMGWTWVAPKISMDRESPSQVMT